MDTLRGNFADRADFVGDGDAYDAAEDEPVRETPPDAIGQDERRMQVRAYNHWASLLDDRNFPSIDDLDPEALPDFGPYSVLLDFTSGIENPGIAYLGAKLAEECGAEGDIGRLADVPARSLLSRITDHYMQILANQAPIGFEAEFVNQRGQTILYRGILLPFSSDDDTIDFIYGVINWKEIADQATTDELMLEIDQALDDEPAPLPRIESADMTHWADGPAAGAEFAPAPAEEPAQEDSVADLDVRPRYAALDGAHLPMPRFGVPATDGYGDYDYDAEDAIEPSEAFADEDADDWSESSMVAVDDGSFGLADWLAAARECAALARSAEDRSRAALYDAISRAYDFSLATADAPEDYAELLEASGIAVQDRAPLTPVVKLVFGADYDKTRLTEYATALAHAHRMGLERGEFAAYLMGADGGLKGVVAIERKLRREEAGKPAAPANEPRARIAKLLGTIAPMGFETIPSEGSEFGLVVIRRLPNGDVAVLGEVSDDEALVERAARKLVA